MDEQRKQSILDPAKVLAGGIASPAAAFLTSRFGVAGTLLGLALSAVLVTTLTDILRVYLARAPTKVKIGGGFRPRFSWQNIRGVLAAPFSWFPSLPPARRRAILISGIAAGGIAFLVGISAVTALELGVGKSLSCWVWNECPEESSTSGKASDTSTLPSILGGGQSAGGNTPQVDSQQQPSPGETPSQPPGVAGSETPTPPTSGQRWSPSGVPVPEDQQPSISPEDRKQSEDQRRSPEGQQQERSPTP